MDGRAKRRGAVAIGAALLLALGWSAAAQAQAAIDWGDDSSVWANDGECDDPRFEGAGMATQLNDGNRLADATDCSKLFSAGRISLRAVAPSVPPAAAGGPIDFGDDSGRWANDGECDDPRFEGEGMAAVLVEEDRLRDATDCRGLFESGAIALRGDAPPATPSASRSAAGIDFGDDSGRWANDGECDDPRFEGAGMAEVLVDEDLYRDASDCLRLYEEGAIELIGETRAATPPPGTPPAVAAPAAPQGTPPAIPAPALRQGTPPAIPAPAAPQGTPPAIAAPVVPGIDFGDDSSRWANDGECDDPRFEGPGMAMGTVEDDRMRDASDCRRLFGEGRITLRP